MSSKIKEALFIGDKSSIQDHDFISMNGIKFIINLQSHFACNPMMHDDTIQYLNFEMTDQSESDDFISIDNQNFVQIIDFIDYGLKNHSCVLVNCYDGNSISPAIIMGYLMVTYSWGADKAYEFLLSKKSNISLNQSYIDQLYSLELEIMKNLGKTILDEKKLTEWDSENVDKNSDELVLVNTFLNTTKIMKSKMEDRLFRQRAGSRCSHSRRIKWLDNSGSSLERPPNWDYSSTLPKNGWIDTFKPRKMSLKCPNKNFCAKKATKLSKQGISFYNLSIEDPSKYAAHENGSENNWHLPSDPTTSPTFNPGIEISLTSNCTNQDDKREPPSELDEQERQKQKITPSNNQNTYIKKLDLAFDFGSSYILNNEEKGRHNPISHNWANDNLKKKFSKSKRNKQKQDKNKENDENLKIESDDIEKKQVKYIPMYLRPTKSSSNRTKCKINSFKHNGNKVNSIKKRKKSRDPLSNRLPSNWNNEKELIYPDSQKNSYVNNKQSLKKITRNYGAEDDDDEFYDSFIVSGNKANIKEKLQKSKHLNESVNSSTLSIKNKSKVLNSKQRPGSADARKRQSSISDILNNNNCGRLGKNQEINQLKMTYRRISR